VDPLALSRLARVRPFPSFLGVSYELHQFPSATGVPATGPNYLFDRLLYGLARYGGGWPTVRVGGGSTDDTFWNPDGEPRPRGINHSIGQAWLAGLTSFATRSRAPLILGLNLATPDPGIAGNLAAAIQGALGAGRVLSYELGNEPELYGIEPRSTDAEGRFFARPRNYSFSQYLSEFSARARYLRQAFPGLPLSGPAIGTVWTPGLPTFLSQNRAALNLATLHYYPFCTCVTDPRAPGYPTLYRLLSPQAVLGFLGQRIAAAATQARRQRLGLRLSEVGSVAGGGGALGPSFASALWGADVMLAMSAVDVRGVNFHTSGTYTPFAFSYDQGWRASVNPLYYAMLFYARATANRGRFLPNATTGIQRAAGVNVSLWANVDHRGTVRVAILNKDLRRSGTVQIRVPRGFFRGTVTRMRAPSALSTTGVTLAGQSFARPTTDARLLGRYLSYPVRRGPLETYRVYMPRTSGAILTVARRR